MKLNLKVNLSHATEKVTIAALLTCFNRRETTLKCLEALNESASSADVSLQIVLVDDASSDGTARAIRQRFPLVHILHGDGDLFWNRGMRKAWQFATRLRPHFYLWLNDDLEVEPAALRIALNTYSKAPAKKTVVVGLVKDPETDELSYGAYTRAGQLSKLSFRRLKSDTERAITMNGNFVLVPSECIRDVGILDDHFSHGMGDIDYGLRLDAAGYHITQTKECVGYQEDNVKHNAATSTMSLRNPFLTFTHPKRVPWREWLYFSRMHGGIIWPLNFVGRYVKMFLLALIKR